MANEILLEEKEGVTAEDVLAKIKRLDGYIMKTKNRIRLHDRSLAIFRAKAQKVGKQNQERLIKGKIYG